MASGRTLEVEVEMCCNVCVEKVEDVVNGMHGVASYRVDRWNSLLTITQTPGRDIADHRQLLKKLKKATHDKKAVLLPPRATGALAQPEPAPASTTTIIYTGYPVMHGPGCLVPWPPSTPSSSPPFITNPNYIKHPVRCGHCWRYSDVVCANCGKGSNFG